MKVMDFGKPLAHYLKTAGMIHPRYMSNYPQEDSQRNDIVKPEVGIQPYFLTYLVIIWQKHS